MPIYEFECDSDKCEANARIEKELPMSKVQDGVECPFCGEQMRKVYSNVSVQFKGSGFYSTNYK